MACFQALPEFLRNQWAFQFFPVKVMLACNAMLGVRALTEVEMRNNKWRFYLRSQGRKGSLSDRRLWGFCFVAV